MSRNLLNKYIWLLETIERHGRLSRAELNDLWLASDISGGEPLARRTFYNYRNGIEEIFGISIAYNSATYEYFIENADTTGELSGWLINSMSINGMLSDAGDIADRVMLEDVPSARRYLATVIDAIKKFRKVKFSYTPFYRSKASEGIIIEPYFLRIFKQRWYVIGYNSKDRMVKTYSLDRVNTLTLTEEHFDDPGISVKEFFKNFFGIMTTKSEAKHVVLRADSEQAKYLRALPLHPSQRETMGDGYSDFDYHLCITYDFIQELLSKGSRIMVVAPAELKAAVVEELRKSLSNYEL